MKGDYTMNILISITSYNVNDVCLCQQKMFPGKMITYRQNPTDSSNFALIDHLQKNKPGRVGSLLACGLEGLWFKYQRGKLQIFHHLFKFAWTPERFVTWTAWIYQETRVMVQIFLNPIKKSPKNQISNLLIQKEDK